MKFIILLVGLLTLASGSLSASAQTITTVTKRAPSYQTFAIGFEGPYNGTHLWTFCAAGVGIFPNTSCTSSPWPVPPSNSWFYSWPNRAEWLRSRGIIMPRAGTIRSIFVADGYENGVLPVGSQVKATAVLNGSETTLQAVITGDGTGYQQGSSSGAISFSTGDRLTVQIEFPPPSPHVRGYTISLLVEYP